MSKSVINIKGSTVIVRVNPSFEGPEVYIIFDSVSF